MSYNLGPYDLMRNHSQLTEFLEPYIDKVDVNNSLLAQIEKTGERINSYFRTGNLDFKYPVMTVAIFGNAVQNIGEFPVVNPNGDYWERCAQEIYAKNLLREEDPWKTLYELEVARYCSDEGFDTRLVHEGQEAGPDIFVYCSDERVDIECKRRDTYDLNIEQDYEVIREEIQDRINIGEDSFFIELTADGPLEEQALESIIDLAVETIENKTIESTVEINGIEYKIILHDYYSGKRNLDIEKSDVERWFSENIFSPHMIQAMLSPFDAEEISPGSYIQTHFKFPEGGGGAVTKDAAVFDFTFPTIDDKYYNRVVNTTLKSGRDDLKNRSPAVLFLHLPAYETEDMRRYFVQEGKYEPTPQIRRLEQRIEGELKTSKSINAVVLNGTYFSTNKNNYQIERGYKVIKNPSPDTPLPEDFERVIC